MSIRKQSGDTIIEVTLAFVIFSIIAIGALTIMNRGVMSSQNNLEFTLVRNQIDSQVEALRFLQRAYSQNPSSGDVSSKFKSIIDNNVLDQNASNFKNNNCINAIPGQKSFLINTEGEFNIISKANIKPSNAIESPPYAQIISGKGYGIWIEGVNGASQGNTKFIDFHVRACWNGATNTNTPNTLGTIVRLYVST